MPESREAWELSALKDPYSAILEGQNESTFWNNPAGLRFIQNLRKDSIFLDLGCGIGRIARHVSSKVAHYYGVDYSNNMIERAKEENKDYPNVTFMVNNGEDLSLFDDEFFDYVFVCLVFQHVPVTVTLGYIKEVFRVLKEGGTFFCFSVPRAEIYATRLTKGQLMSAVESYTITHFEQSKSYYQLVLVKPQSEPKGL